ncbi:MAG: hypothetical protein MI923_16585 [Phycisphaerales bacterium]|nr:hypothetical protein [Phycisphaerales bacterium]
MARLQDKKVACRSTVDREPRLPSCGEITGLRNGRTHSSPGTSPDHMLCAVFTGFNPMGRRPDGRSMNTVGHGIPGHEISMEVATYRRVKVC